MSFIFRKCWHASEVTEIFLDFNYTCTKLICNCAMSLLMGKPSVSIIIYGYDKLKNIVHCKERAVIAQSPSFCVRALLVSETREAHTFICRLLSFNW